MKLKDCPFCGTEEEYLEIKDDGEGYIIIRCCYCSARSDEFGSEECAIKAWNTRAEPKELTISIDQFRKLIEYLSNEDREGSFRYLIYDVMGFDSDAYSALYSTGLMGFNEYVQELRAEPKGDEPSLKVEGLVGLLNTLMMSEDALRAYFNPLFIDKLKQALAKFKGGDHD